MPLALAQQLAETMLGSPRILQSLKIKLPVDLETVSVVPLLALSLVNASAQDPERPQISFRDLISALTRSSFPGEQIFLGELSHKTTTFGNPQEFRYPVMSYLTSVYSEWNGHAGSRLSQVWAAWTMTLVSTYASYDTESEAQSVLAMPVIVTILQGAPELVAANAFLANAFASSSDLTDLLAECPAVYDALDNAAHQAEDAAAAEVRGTTKSAPSSPAPAAKTQVDFSAEPGWKLYDHAEVASALKACVDARPGASNPMTPGEKPSARVLLLEKLAKSSAVREVVQLPKSFDFLQDLRSRFPHFKDVIDFLERHFALYGSGEDGSPAQFPPILLRGSAGIGKTFFGQTLAEHLKVRFEERDLSIMSDSMVISGMASTWKDSAPGLVFETLANHGQANPLILLNEVDKCTVFGREHRSPMSAMYALLEKRSAKNWADEFAAIPIDTTRVNWILTANNGEIPAPILSRVQVFDVRNPTVEEQRAIVRHIWTDLVTRDFPKGSGFSTDLPDDVCEFGTSLSSREVGKILMHGAGEAVLSQRRTLTVADLHKVRLQTSGSGEQRRVGF